jgi:head-tail adaptor
MSCKKTRIKENRYCIGDLKTKAIFYTRSLTARTDDEIDPNETFSGATTAWVGIQSIKGIDFFDGTNLNGTATIKMVARYSSSIEEKKWIVVNSKYFKVLQSINVSQQSIWLEYLCEERGTTANKCNKS